MNLRFYKIGSIAFILFFIVASTFRIYRFIVGSDGEFDSGSYDKSVIYLGINVISMLIIYLCVGWFVGKRMIGDSRFSDYIWHISFSYFVSTQIVLMYAKYYYGVQAVTET